MWFFNKKEKIEDSGILAGGIDYHTHILPGVDDGVKEFETSLEILAKHEKAGYREIWLTPHTMEDYPNTAHDLRERFATLCEAYKGGLTLHLATEYMLDNYFEQLLESKELLPIGKEGNHLLVETSYYTPPIHLYNTLQRIKAKGYHPLFAHAERYLYLEKENYKTLQEMGVKMQLNIPSLAGVYGPEIQKKAFWLLKNEMYSVTGSDTHCPRAIEVIKGLTLDKSSRNKLNKILQARL